MAAPDRDELIAMLAVYYDVHPRLFYRMDDKALAAAWHAAQATVPA